MNFADHFCNDHSNCSRFIWFSLCSEPTGTLYTPTKSYCNSISSERGPYCNLLIPKIFKLLVHAFCLSEYMEGVIWRTCHYLRTTGCESYFHWKGIFIPKWSKTSNVEYPAREAAAFMIFQSRKEQRELDKRVLQSNKNAQTLIATAGQKRCAYEPHLAKIYKDLFCRPHFIDPLSDAYANFTMEKSTAWRSRRQRFLTKSAEKFAGGQHSIIQPCDQLFENISLHIDICTRMFDCSKLAPRPNISR